MRQFLHPATEDIQLSALLAALSDTTRLQIVRALLCAESCKSCTEAAPYPDIAKSTLSNHFRVLREAGLIRTEQRGVEHRNSLRRADIEKRFPGLLTAIMSFVD